jgi:hypothetical protein
MSRNSGALAATLGGGVIAALLCGLLGRLATGFPPALVESWLISAPAPLHPFIEELGNGFSPDRNPDDMPTAAFLAIQIALWGVMWFTGWQVLRQPDSRGGLLAILGFALLFRLLLLPTTPIHSSAAFRYLWDGATTAHGINPYLYEPAVFMMRDRHMEKPTEIDGRIYRGRTWSATDEERIDRLSALRDQNPGLHDAITDANLPSSHPPLAQAFFALASLLSISSLTGLKTIVVVFDLGVIVLLLRLLRRLRLRRGGVIFYAWSPIVLVSFANAGHWESVPLFFFLWALTLAMRRKAWAGTVILALAGGNQTGWLAQAPVLFRPSWRHLGNWAVLTLLIAVAFLPFIWWQNAGWAPIGNGLRWLESAEPSLPGVFLAVQTGCGAIVSSANDNRLLALIVCGFLFLCFFVWNLLQSAPDHYRLLRKSFALAASLFILSPGASPWQFVWIIPFLCVFPKPSWIILMLTIHASFLQFHTDYADFTSPAGFIPWLHLAVWGSFFLLCVLDPLLLRLLDRPVSASGQDSSPALPS